MTTFGVALVAAGLAAYAPAAAPTHDAPAAPSGSESPRVGFLTGAEFGFGDTGLALRGDLALPFSRVSSNLALDGVLSAQLTWFDEDGWRSGFDRSLVIFGVGPAVRLNVVLPWPRLAGYGDAGVVLYHGWLDVDGGGRDYASDRGFGVAMRFAAGLGAKVGANTRVGGEVAVNPYVGEFDDTTVTLMVSATFGL